MLEKELEKYFNAKAKQCRDETLSYKFLSSVAGVPDRVLMNKVYGVCFVELKTDTGKLSNIQKFIIQRMKSVKTTVVVVYGRKGIDQLFEDWNDRFVLNEIYPTSLSNYKH